MFKTEATLVSLYFSLLDANVLEDTLFQDLEAHIAFAHVKQLLSFLQVVVGSLIGSADVKHLYKTFCAKRTLRRLFRHLSIETLQA